MLYSLLFTHDCVTVSDNNFIIKFADDTTVGGLITNDETSYRNEVNSIITWCSENNLELNVKKTKEIIVDFRRNPSDIVPLVINNSEVEIVQYFKFLGVYLSVDLKWEINTDHIVKKSQKRLFFLRRLRSFRVSQGLLIKFYRAVIESVLTLSIIVWWGNATVDDRKRLNRIVNTASSIIGCQLPSLNELYNAQVKERAQSIVKDDFHPARNLLQLMRSGERYRSIKSVIRDLSWLLY
ncbi:uncharacterized protein LOC144434757 [Glandiceps talaboti]